MPRKRLAQEHTVEELSLVRRAARCADRSRTDGHVDPADRGGRRFRRVCRDQRTHWLLGSQGPPNADRTRGRRRRWCAWNQLPTRAMQKRRCSAANLGPARPVGPHQQRIDDRSHHPTRPGVGPQRFDCQDSPHFSQRCRPAGCPATDPTRASPIPCLLSAAGPTLTGDLVSRRRPPGSR